VDFGIRWQQHDGPLFGHQSSLLPFTQDRVSARVAATPEDVTIGAQVRVRFADIGDSGFRAPEFELSERSSLDWSYAALRSETSERSSLRDRPWRRSTRGEVVASQVPLVDYLVPGDEPHLVAHECTACGARYFDRRNACASCFATDFRQVAVATEGEVLAYTIVAFAAPGIPVPFVAAVVDCDGTSVRANLINVEPDPEHVKLGMKVRIATYSVGTDEESTEAIGFGFEPA
jgi:uncharacterized OB-fold protein